MDNATPGANGLAAVGLLRLAALTGDERYREHGEAIVRLLGAMAVEHPTAFGHVLAAVDLVARGTTEIVVAGDRPDLLASVRVGVPPNAVLAWGERYDSPLWEGRDDGRAYVCQGYACQLPAIDGRPSSPRSSNSVRRVNRCRRLTRLGGVTAMAVRPPERQARARRPLPRPRHAAAAAGRGAHRRPRARPRTSCRRPSSGCHRPGSTAGPRRASCAYLRRTVVNLSATATTATSGSPGRAAPTRAPASAVAADARCGASRRPAASGRRRARAARPPARLHRPALLRRTSPTPRSPTPSASAPGSVKTHLHRARATLADLLGGPPMNEPPPPDDDRSAPPRALHAEAEGVAGAATSCSTASSAAARRPAVPPYRRLSSRPRPPSPWCVGAGAAALATTTSDQSTRSTTQRRRPPSRLVPDELRAPLDACSPAAAGDRSRLSLFVDADGAGSGRTALGGRRAAPLDVDRGVRRDDVDRYALRTVAGDDVLPTALERHASPPRTTSWPCGASVSDLPGVQHDQHHGLRPGREPERRAPDARRPRPRGRDAGGRRPADRVSSASSTSHGDPRRRRPQGGRSALHRLASSSPPTASGSTSRPAASRPRGRPSGSPSAEASRAEVGPGRLPEGQPRWPARRHQRVPGRRSCDPPRGRRRHGRSRSTSACGSPGLVARRPPARRRRPRSAPGTLPRCSSSTGTGRRSPRPTPASRTTPARSSPGRPTGCSTIGSGGPVDDDRTPQPGRLLRAGSSGSTRRGVVREQAGFESGDRPPIEGLPEALAADW